MSTQIKKITGRFAEEHHADFTVDYGESNIYLTRFYGGDKYGTMIQITISNPKDTSYVQLTKEQVKELADVLNSAFDYKKYPSD